MNSPDITKWPRLTGDFLAPLVLQRDHDKDSYVLHTDGTVYYISPNGPWIKVKGKG